MSKCSKCGGVLFSTQTIQGHETAIWHAVCPAASAKHTTPTINTVDIDKLEKLLAYWFTVVADGQLYHPNGIYVKDAAKEIRTHLKAELLAKIDGLEVDEEATGELIKEAGGTETDILNMEISADDRHGVLNDVRQIVNEL